MNVLIKCPDDKFHLCRVIEIIPSINTLLPEVAVRAIEGRPFDGRPFAIVNMLHCQFVEDQQKENNEI